MTSDAIPQRLLDYAKTMIDKWPQPSVESGNVRYLAAALLAAEKRGAMEERERAAKVADSWATNEQRRFGNGGPAAAIRNQPEPDIK